jgi:hypothetical protein
MGRQIVRSSHRGIRIIRGNCCPEPHSRSFLFFPLTLLFFPSLLFYSLVHLDAWWNRIVSLTVMRVVSLRSCEQTRSGCAGAPVRRCAGVPVHTAADQNPVFPQALTHSVAISYASEQKRLCLPPAGSPSRLVSRFFLSEGMMVQHTAPDNGRRNMSAVHRLVVLAIVGLELPCTAW